MADVGFDRSDPAIALCIGAIAVGIGEGGNLNGVADIGAGAVAFDVIDGFRVHPRSRQRLAHCCGLSIHRRGQISRLGRTIVVDRRAFDDRPDVVAIGHRIAETPERHRSRARAEHGALRAVVKGVAMAIGRQDLVFLVEVAAPLRQLDRHATGQRHIAFALAQCLGGVVDRHERGGAGGLHVDRWSLEIKDMADARGQEILVIAGVAQEEHAHVIDQIRVRADVEVKIAAHAAARIDTDLAFQAFGCVTGILHRAPCDLKELAVLRVEDRGLFGRKPKELRVKLVKALQPGGRGHVVGIAQGLGAFASSKQAVFVNDLDRLNAITQIGPILVN